ncbi:uncharacterized protein LOC110617173 isoform X1 [Manihot esculenta]|uniref:Uncharacterized protein n=1 Tax=Manihot esculenta TaxID=3983 RepID=A0A2C9VPW2_MANES|nr:uncharacterized protein LOC110617173 isoform X1 [Manihot esculenta]OAY47806.1 hypothetical protein MANES_06G107000v8 [Manihot esculenta]
MAANVGSSSFSCVPTSFYSFTPKKSSQLSLVKRLKVELHHNSQKLRNGKVNLCQFIGGTVKLRGNFARQNVLYATPQDHTQYNEVKSDELEPEDEDDNSTAEIFSPISRSLDHSSGTDGKPGLLSFYNRPYKTEGVVIKSDVQKDKSRLLWFVGPAVLVASFIFPSLYLRRILSTVFEDSLLTDFLILFFTEALFYCGVAIFLLLIDHLRRPVELESAENGGTTLASMGQRISSVAALVLSLIIPMVTMGLVWPWTGPAASATLAPYLVGIVVQFAFEQYARYRKSPSWPVIPIIFQVYRLHQLNRAAQLVTALSFTVKGAEMTSHNLEISSSLGTLLNVLQFLGVICIWSLSSFLMKFYPSTGGTAE